VSGPESTVSMTINHIMIGSCDPESSVKFYSDFLGFRRTTDHPGAEGGAVLTHEASELLIIPFPKDRLPNPAHFAFEVNSLEQFTNLLTKAEGMGLAPRSQPFSRGPRKYRIFYVFDPSGVNLEVMVEI
jgi:catechol 2,3-dioxygenase-like lactoylglutathione lyase family enzyme